MGPVSEYGHPCRKLTFDRSKQRSTIYDRVERLDLKVQMKASESSTVAVLTEKPSVARDIARVLGADKRGEGYLQGNGYVVTWAIGHLVSLAQPHEINPQWRQWRMDLLPILPEQWPLVVYERTKDQFAFPPSIRRAYYPRHTRRR